MSGCCNQTPAGEANESVVAMPEPAVDQAEATPEEEKAAESLEEKPAEEKPAEEQAPQEQSPEQVNEDLEAPPEAQAETVERGEPPKKKTSCCAKCCKCYCCCCCSCLLVIVIAGIVAFNTVLKVDTQYPSAPAAPSTDVMLGVSYGGSSDPNSDATFKSNLVSGVLGALPGSFSDTDGSIANSLLFSPSRRLGSSGESRELSSSAWTVVIPIVGEAAVSAADVFTSSSFNPASITSVVSLSVSSGMSVLTMGHLLKDLNFACKSVIAKVIDSYRSEIIDKLEKKNVTGVTLGISEEGWVWATFSKSGWRSSATALGCEATQLWEAAIKAALELDLGACTLSEEGVSAVVASGKGGDRCYFDSIRKQLSPTELKQCPAAGSTCTSSQSGVCDDFEYPGCSSCPTPSSAKYLPCTPFA